MAEAVAVARSRLPFWAIIIALVICAFAGVFILLWFKLPTWVPEWVVEHSPFLDPVVRSVSEDTTLDERGRARVSAWGLDVGPTLIPYLVDERLLTRSFAARCLGMLKDRRAVDGLIAMATTDQEEDCVIDAIAALGSLADERAIPPLVELLQGDAWSVALDALLKCPHAAVTDAILPFRPETKTEVFFELAVSLQDPRALAAMASAMREPVQEESQRDPEELYLSYLVHAPGPLASYALSGADRPEAIEEILSAFKDPVEQVRCNVVLGVYRRTWGVDVSKGHPFDSQLFALMQDALHDPSPTVRKFSALAWQFIPLDGAEKILIPLLADSDAETRYNAVAALGVDRTSNKAVTFMAPLLKDPYPWVQHAAVYALGMVGAADPLIAAWDGADAKLQLWIAQAFVKEPLSYSPKAFQC